MNDLMEWFQIFFVFYVFISVWVISSMLDKILKLLSDIIDDVEQNKREANANNEYFRKNHR